MAGSAVSVRGRTKVKSALDPFQPRSAAERRWYGEYRRAYDLERQQRHAEAAAVLQASLKLAREARCEACTLRSLANLGAGRLAASQHRAAMESFLEARRLAERLGDREMIGVLSLNLSNLYLHRFALPEAIGAAEEATAALGQATQPWLRTKVLIQRARLTARQGDMEAAGGIYAEVVAEASRSGDVASEALAWEHYGLEHLRRGHLAQAERALVEAFRLRRSSDDAGLGASCHSLALLRLEQGDAGAALRLADRAIEEWRRRPALRPMWQLRLARGRALAGLGRGREALAELDLALELIRTGRVAMLPADELRISYGVGIHEVYAARIETGNEVALAAGDRGLVEEGFRLAEQARSQSLRQATGEWERLRQRLPDEYFEELSRLQAAQAAQLRDGDAARRRELEMMRRRLTEIEAESGMALVNGEPAAEEQLRRPDLAADEALLSFFLGRRHSYLWAATARGIELHRLPGRAELAGRVERFAAAVRDGGEPAAALGESLYRTLLGNASAAVKSRRRWLLSLDGELFDLPFAGLVAERRDGAPVYLVQRHSLEVVPGVWALGQSAGAAWSGPMVALGDAVYNVADRRWTGAARARVQAGLELPRLAGSGREVRACLRAWGRGGAILEGLDAGWEDLVAEIRRRRPGAIHLATHYVVSPAQPRQALLALGLSRRGEWQYIGAEQIAALRPAPALVVMSGCGSGDGRTVAGEGRVGLARAWLRSGARAVAATYWPTPDDPGALPEEFYRQLQRPNPDGAPVRPAEALRRAQLEMIRRGSWTAEPRYWASYFLAGKS
jgi:CHAT domain-containing protein